MADEEPAGWFPEERHQWRFDVITLLAIVGENSIAEHLQTITASTFCLLPRIIPAPQALLKPTRPQRLPPVNAAVIGVYGGTLVESVSYFANIIHPLDELKPLTFKVLEIKHKDMLKRIPRKKGPWWKNLLGGNKGQHIELERPGTSTNVHQVPSANTAGSPTGGPKRKDTVQFAVETDLERGSSAANPSTPAFAPPKRTGTMGRIGDSLTTLMHNDERYAVPPALWSPVNILSVLSVILSTGIIIAAAFWKDGTAIVAIGVISVSSSVVCYASWWKPLLMSRVSKNKVPEGDMVIRTREGAFILVKCTEDVARELYTGTEECQYVCNDIYHRAFMGLGMVMLMFAIVLLGNCKWNSQVFIGASYVLLNGLYWGMGMLPAHYFWDLSRYEWTDVTPEDVREFTKKMAHKEVSPSFTLTLWHAIRETKHSAWVERSGAMPLTDKWKEWLKEATEQAWKGNKDWDAVKRKDEIMARKEEVQSTGFKIPVDPSEKEPLVPVEGLRRREPAGQEDA
ncbi:hypothetical protein QBC35DRAFT_56422 [Podospora australis]|uniref:Uncharacterized protein n=1 Tax=Podospora australis TaxID=1536484 RepID=A0AAN7AJC5_9PEZI|nr:hypothetical protein QBC35DRAFT_56422 [Podospora australis]